MKFLVIGGAGFLGTQLVSSLLDDKHEVIIYDKLLYSNLTDISRRATFIHDDVKNFSKHKAILENVDGVYYLAGPRLNDIKDEKVIKEELENLGNFLKCLKEYDTTLIFTSSCSVYGASGGTFTEESPTQVTSLYSKLKIESEDLIKKENNSKYYIVRLSTLFGSGKVPRPDLMINNFILDAYHDKKLEIFDPHANRPHLWLTDAAIILRQLMNRVIDEPQKEKILNIGYNQFTFTKYRLALELKRVLDIDFEIIKHNTQDSRDYIVDFSAYNRILAHNPSPIGTALKNAYEVVNRIVMSLEDYHSILNYYLPNTCSPSFYVNEEREMRLPKMWGHWNIVDEEGKWWPQESLDTLVTPNMFFPFDITWKTKEELKPGENHLYCVHVFNGDYFTFNKDIGLSCVSEQYLNDLRSGVGKLVFICTLEGYSGETYNEDFEIIEKWIKRYNIPGGNVYYISGNLIGSEVAKKKGCTFNVVPCCMFDSWMPLHELPKKIEVPFNPVDDKFLYLSYARNPRHQRVLLGAKLIQNNLLNRGRLSLGKWTFNKGIDDHIWPKGLNYLKQISEKTPIEIDRILDYNLATDLTLEDYEATFLSIINETLTNDGTLFLSEKIFKPLLVGHPFLVIGNVGTLKYLKSLGYKTFDKWFDESYDEELDFIKRVDKVVKEVNKFRFTGIHTLREIRDDMKDVLEHNTKVFYKQIHDKYKLNDNHFLEDPYGPVRKELQKIYKNG